jgi:hypothetical protein
LTQHSRGRFDWFAFPASRLLFYWGVYTLHAINSNQKNAAGPREIIFQRSPPKETQPNE